MIGFEDFVRAIHGFTPYRWQSEVNSLFAKPEYDQLFCPTGTGKTLLIDMWVHALLTRPARTVPTRLFWCIDRRVVVDQVGDHCQKIARFLTDGAGKEMGDALMKKLGTDRPLVAQTLRGGLARAKKVGWEQWPHQPAVITSTFDQFGSRLLFAGYGVSSKVRPIHAALTGLDSLVVVDESHAAAPFVRTVKAAFALAEPGRLALAKDGLPLPASRLIEVSATPRPGGKRFPVMVDPSKDKALTNRMIEKEYTLHQTDDFSKQAAEVATNLIAKGQRYVFVVCNTVGGARKVHTVLSKSKDLKGLVSKDRLLLVTARCRLFERDRVAAQLQEFVCGQRPTDPKPAIVVSTQSIEMGADFDADGMVVEACAADALRQRAGRLNRVGRMPRSVVHVIVSSKRTKAVYGEATDRTVELLHLLTHDGFAVLPDELPPNTYTPATPAATLTATLVRQLSRTRPAPQMDIHGLIHGVSRPITEFNLVWRDNLTTEMLESARAGDQDALHTLRQLVLAAPPQQKEMIDLPRTAARASSERAASSPGRPRERSWPRSRR
jgi:CRISPR-associated endonuclease/helicase Cas3